VTATAAVEALAARVGPPQRAALVMRASAWLDLAADGLTELGRIARRAAPLAPAEGSQADLAAAVRASDGDAAAAIGLGAIPDDDWWALLTEAACVAGGATVQHSVKLLGATPPGPRGLALACRAAAWATGSPPDLYLAACEAAGLAPHPLLAL